MKKLFIVALLATLISLPSFSQFTTSFYGGSNVSWLRYGELDQPTGIPGLSQVESDVSDAKISGELGLRTQFFLSHNMLLKTGVGYSARGFDEVLGHLDTETELRVALRYLDIPVMIGTFRFMDHHTGNIVTLAAGFQYSRLLSSGISTRSVGAWNEVSHQTDMVFKQNSISVIGSFSVQPSRLYLEATGGLGLTSPLEKGSGSLPFFFQMRAGVNLF